MTIARGGKREGAGRPKGRNQYGEPTKAMRIPLSRISEIQSMLTSPQDSYSLPLFSDKVSAGFPSPADDYIEMQIDLNRHLIKHPSATFFVVASGDSMINAGICSGDMLVVDRSAEAVHGKIVIAAVNGELTVKRLSRSDGRVKLMPENSKYTPIDITEDEDLVIWGVVTYVIHEAR